MLWHQAKISLFRKKMKTKPLNKAYLLFWDWIIFLAEEEIWISTATFFSDLFYHKRISMFLVYFFHFFLLTKPFTRMHKIQQNKTKKTIDKKIKSKVMERAVNVIEEQVSLCELYFYLIEQFQFQSIEIISLCSNQRFIQSYHALMYYALLVCISKSIQNSKYTYRDARWD